MRLTYYAADGSTSLAFEDPIRLLNLEGVLATLATPQTTRAPGQAGATLLDHQVAPRVVTLQLAILASSWEDHWALREQLARALTVTPARHGEAVEAGTLRLERDGAETVELPAVPQTSPQETPVRGAPVAFADVELFCPDPYWRAVADDSVLLQPGGAGVSYPLTYPITYPSGSVELEVTNRGGVDAPPLIRVYGSCTDPKLSNLTTGAAIRVMGTIAAGDFVEIETAFGRKAITYVASTGSRTNWMDHLDLANDDFWHLRPGVNSLRLDVASGSGHQALVVWRPRWAGV